MANPIIKIKRSAVAGKIPTSDQMPLGEIALNTYDGYLYASKNVGIGTTVIVINPFRVGAGTDTYNAYFTAGNVGIGSTLPTSALVVEGDANVTGVVTASSFETTKGGTGNFFAGYQSGLTADTNSDYNVAIGYQAGYDLANSDYNVAIGYQALYDTANNATTGNVAIGYRTLYNAETGDYNIAIGYDVQQYLTTGSHNIALGYRSQSGNYVTGQHNISLGYQSLYTISSGFGNVGLGAYSGQGIYTGSYNTLLGYYAGFALDTPQNYNTFVGAFAGQNVDGGDYMVALGAYAGNAAEGDQSVFIGANAGAAAVNTFGSIYVGYQAGYDSEGTYNVAMGYQSMYDGSSGGAFNIALGYQSLYQDSADRNFNIAIGYRALFGDASTSTGDYNIALGREAGELLTTGSGNIFLGSYAGDNVTTGSNNIVIKASQSDYADVDATTSNQLWIGYDDKSWITGDTNNVGLNYGGDLRLETTGYGVSVYNTLQAPQLNITGIVTATGGFNLGISSAGTSITSGPVTTLNFIGAGNTFAVSGTTVDISIAGGGGGSQVSVSTVAPSGPSEGDLWYNSNLARTFVYYDDGSSQQWVDVAPFNQGGTNSTVTVSSSAPTSPSEGQLWYSTTLARTFIYYQDGSSSQWVDAAPFNTQTTNKTLTIGTRTTAGTLTLVGTGLTVALRSGVGTANF